MTQARRASKQEVRRADIEWQLNEVEQSNGIHAFALDCCGRYRLGKTASMPRVVFVIDASRYLPKTISGP